MRKILEAVVKGDLSIQKAEDLLRTLAIEEIGSLAKIDTEREERRGVPEFILAEGKTPEDTVQIAVKMVKKSGRAIISRASNNHINALSATLPKSFNLQVYDKSKMVIIKRRNFKIRKTSGKIGIVSAGTSDIPIAEEAKVIIEEMGCQTVTAYDIGVAGLHRLLQPLKEMIAEDVDAIIVVAGREGALASVVAGIVNVPVIAVPTSCGYGFGEKGVSALMAMLQSCSLGLAVVNIDSGVAAGTIATLIANRVAKFRGKIKEGKIE